MLRNGSRTTSTGRGAGEQAHQQDSRLRELMIAAQNGHRPAYETLLRECVPMIRRMARQHGAGPDALDDIVQDVLLTIHRARHTYDPARPFIVWVSMIVHRRAVDAIRRRARRQEHETHSPDDYEAYAEPQTPYQELGGGRAMARVREAIEDLPEAQREAISRLALKEQSLQEAARETGRSAGSLKVNLHRALKALRARLGAGE
jgi:RNA polymerase sigma-70 factor (ECF subfamily)